jgi:hypothetical protein
LLKVGGFESLSFGERDCRNYINKARELRLGKGGAQALCDYFRRMQKQNSGFYFVMDMDDDCRLQNVFWADAWNKAAYDFFGDVITFDIMYLTNRYDMPFAPSVGDGDQGTASKDLVQVPIGPVTRARAKKFKDVLNGLIQELWAQAILWRPIEHDPRGQQRTVTLIQVLEGSGQG